MSNDFTDINKMELYGFVNTRCMFIRGNANQYIINIQPPLQNVIGVEITKAHVPSSEYSIEAENNIISLTNASGTFNATINSQDYTETEFITGFNNSVSNTGVFISTIANEGKFLLSSSSTFTVNASSTISEPIGFNGFTSYTATSVSPNFTLEPPNRYFLSGTDVIIIECTELDTQLNSGMSASNAMPLGVLYLDSIGTTNERFDLQRTTRYFSPIASLSRMTLKFKRPSLQYYYNFHGLNWNLQLEFKCIEAGKDWSMVGKNDNLKYILAQQEFEEQEQEQNEYIG